MFVSLPPKLESSLRDSPTISRVFDGWNELELPNCWMVAGAVFQSYWNRQFGFPPLHGISDIDLIYFDADDLTEKTENEHYLRINSCYEDAGLRFDVKNEARLPGNLKKEQIKIG